MVFNMAAEFGFPSLDAYLYHNKGVNPTLAKFDILNPIKLLALSHTMSKIGLEQLNYKLEVLENPAHGMERNFFINPLTVQGGKINCSTLNSPNRSNEREFFRYPVYLPNPERMQNIIALPFDYTTFDELLDAKQFAQHEGAIYQAFDQIVDISAIFHSYFANPYDQIAY